MFGQQIVNGLVLGSTYSLIAIGYTLVFGLLYMLNLAHPDIFMLGAFAGLFSLRLGLPLAGAFAVAILVGGILNIIVDLLCFETTKSGDVLAAPVLATVCVSLMAENSATKLWGSDPTQFPSSFGLTPLHVGSVTFTLAQVAVMAVSAALIVVIALFLKRTNLGRGVRAVAENPETAEILGVNSRVVVTATFFVSGALAGAAGVLVGVLFSAISPFMGLDQGLKAIAAMVIGGLGNFWGAGVAGLIIGVAEVLTAAYTNSSLSGITVYGLLLVVLLLRPQGLFGQRLPAGRF